MTAVGTPLSPPRSVPRSPRLSTPPRQLYALVALRWQMVRSARSRRGLLVALAAPLLLTAVAVIAAQHAPDRLRANLTLLTPTVFLAFAVLALLAPLAAGGGGELFPPEQLVGYPIRPASHFLASLVVAPLNLAWMAEFVVLVAATAYTTPPTPRVALALVTTCGYVALVTAAGQAIAWLVVGVRQRAAGRRAVWLLAGMLAASAVAVVQAGALTTVLDHAPTASVVTGVFAGGAGRYAGWAARTGVLLGLTVVALALGARWCGWALRRPGDAGVLREGRPVRRRAPRRTVLRELVAIDRASVWRSRSLRRGLLVLAILPGAAAAAAGISWSALALVPGLVAAGAGLLFGVNVFCLDASGAIWLASLPYPPRLVARAKTWVVAETCVLAVLIAVTVGSLRAPGAPTASQLSAVLAAAAASVATVVATCLHLSVTRPHRAELRGARDAPAPPASMALYSARLAASTTFIGLLISTMSYAGSWWLPLVVAVPFVARAGRSVVRSLARWDDPLLRARVVATVASG